MRRRSYPYTVLPMVCGFILLVCVTAGKAGNDASPPANSTDSSPSRRTGLIPLRFAARRSSYSISINSCISVMNAMLISKAPTYDCDKYLRIPGSFHLPFGAHRDMVFNHGLNLRCFNCHNCANLGTYINYDGSEIPGDTPVLLCRKCHGTTYRDWVAGIHGRTNGYWDASRGKQAKLDCNQCHNPHQPHFPRLVPRPSPAAARTQLSEKGSRHE